MSYTVTLREPLYFDGVYSKTIVIEKYNTSEDMSYVYLCGKNNENRGFVQVNNILGIVWNIEPDNTVMNENTIVGS